MAQDGGVHSFHTARIMPDFLREIVVQQREEIRRRQVKISLKSLRQKAHNQSPCLDFIAALRRKEKRGAFIAEMKKASPSAGLLRQDYDVAHIATDYAKNGAACLSVLTNERFQGEDAHLQQVRAAVNIPLLRKDFIVDAYQVYESRFLGADAILLIAACLGDEELRELQNVALEVGMAVLVEVHNEEELRQAIEIGARLIGVNNRNLHSFETELEVGERLLPLVAREEKILAVAESGIKRAADMKRLAACGAQAFLVGESFMRARYPGSALAELIRAL